ncbi:MAG: hypothetical protein Q4C67_10505, partial [Deinococcus sp.]|nr:hypothetical protein [Deinococcus sp.]
MLGQLAQPGQLAPRQQVLRSVTGEAELLGALGAYPPQTRVELWGQLLSAAPNRLMIHGMRPLEAQVPTGPALL